MKSETNILTDNFGRHHSYLRISLTEKCNLRCTYCMPENGVPLTPKSNIMTADEIFKIATVFVKHGVTKIRLTGGEPLVRKDFSKILERLSTLNIKLSITTNAVIVDRFIDNFKASGLQDINVSLDSLQADKFTFITRRNQFKAAYNNIILLLEQGFNVKMNVVLIKGFNDDEIIDFIAFTKHLPIAIRFIEFMPFDGNNWNKEKLVTQAEILEQTHAHFGRQDVISLENEANFTSRNYQIKGYKGTFGIISSVSNPFCDSCNRIRLTANGNIKNCLFSNQETNLLEAYRQDKNIEPLISNLIKKKYAVRAGMTDFETLNNPENHTNNRSMITIGG
ncbi:molybdenum cofactor biosynthesis protein MoaA [Formosa agariphila KMM 3901]|uniref:GTP 3',8-cyclase n=1 Tax=Formosa agariphila (strain DSM 15362 / KCTC 12365 / LMG 23005 / KMM 3901 / M-2Alg 35-1) TaxID=1347342 RepID=T2KK43_FORAG|nr:GTP 3',8-cyclase MoaA [Formosa agariphila]CDF78364.1 molybdenum cofactor biosynthesis protein MoaA [Formosa agariphila KMM 3901]